MTERNEQKKKAGQVAVENGQLVVTDPQPGGQPALLILSEGVTLKVNGEQVKDVATVTTADRVEIETATRVDPAEIKVSVSENKMKAYLEIKPEIKIEHILRDQSPRQKLELATEQKVTESIPFNLQDLMQEIKKQGIVGASEEAVKKALETARYERVLIATGKPVTPPRDETVEIKIRAEKSTRPVVRANGRVDFKEYAGGVVGVEPGDVIAEVIPGAPGQPGIDVYGNQAQPRYPLKVELRTGSGTRLAGSQVVATAAGQPEIKKSGQNYHISVQPNLVHKGAVNIDSGNLRFKGNLEVHGNVEQGMLVSAAGRVTINGLVTGASIVSGDDLTINGHAIVSKLEAGASLSNIEKLRPLLEELGKSLDELFVATKYALTKLDGKAPFGKIVTLLVEKKYPAVAKNVKELLSVVGAGGSFPREIEELAVLLKNKLWGINVTKLAGVEELKEIIDRNASTAAYLKILLNNRANAYLQYTLNSNIEATGDVFVTGQGCIDTRIKAGGSVYVTGIFRGGYIQAGGNVTIHEAGSKGGVPTVISVPEDKTVYISKAFENVTINIGEQKLTLSDTKTGFKASLDVYDVIEISSWAGKIDPRVAKK